MSIQAIFFGRLKILPSWNSEFNFQIHKVATIKFILDLTSDAKLQFSNNIPTFIP